MKRIVDEMFFGDTQKRHFVKVNSIKKNLKWNLRSFFQLSVFGIVR